VLSAFALVAATTASGIVIATWLEARDGVRSFGYLALDQCLLPLTTLPLVALLGASPALRRLVGEPRWSAEAECSPSLAATMERTWEELCAPPRAVEEAAGGAALPAAGAAEVGAAPGAARRGCPGALTLAAYHFLELIRNFFFFYLVTAFDAESTYLTMTLLRIALVSVASLLACTLLRRWVGVRELEARSATAPRNLAMRALGAALILFAVLRIKAVLRRR